MRKIIPILVLLALAGGTVLIARHINQDTLARNATTQTLRASTTTSLISTASPRLDLDSKHSPSSETHPQNNVFLGTTSAPVVPVSKTTTASSTLSGESVTLTVEGTHYMAPWHEGLTVIEAMRTLTSEGFSFTGENYPSLGFFVESIQGKKNQNAHYWFLYINGVSAPKGASQTVLKSGDSAEWRYEKN